MDSRSGVVSHYIRRIILFARKIWSADGHPSWRYQNSSQGILLLLSNSHLYSIERLSHYSASRSFEDIQGAPLRESLVDLTLVIPAFNEEECIEECVLEADSVLKGLGKSYEILVVDDGSMDRTFEKLMVLKKEVHRLRAIRFRENRGQTTAMAAGFEHSRGAIVVTMDADLQNDPTDIPRLLEYMDRYDVVCGVRRNRCDSVVRKVSSWIANNVRNRFTGESIKDVGCTLRAYRSSYLRRIKLFEGMHRFLPTLLRLEGARVVEIAVNHRPRFGGTNKYGISNRLWKALRDLEAVRWMQDRYVRYEVEKEIE